MSFDEVLLHTLFYATQALVVQPTDAMLHAWQQPDDKSTDSLHTDLKPAQLVSALQEITYCRYSLISALKLFCDHIAFWISSQAFNFCKAEYSLVFIVLTATPVC